MSKQRSTNLPDDPEPQQLIIVAHFRVTGQPDLVPRFGEPFVSPDAKAVLLELGWTEPVVAGALPSPAREVA